MVIVNEALENSGEHSIQLNIMDYPKGIYFVRFQTAQSQMTKKVVVQ